MLGKFTVPDKPGSLLLQGTALVDKGRPGTIYLDLCKTFDIVLQDIIPTLLCWEASLPIVGLGTSFQVPSNTNHNGILQYLHITQHKTTAPAINGCCLVCHQNEFDALTDNSLNFHIMT